MPYLLPRYNIDLAPPLALPLAPGESGLHQLATLEGYGALSL